MAGNRCEACEDSGIKRKYLPAGYYSSPCPDCCTVFSRDRLMKLLAIERSWNAVRDEFKLFQTHMTFSDVISVIERENKRLKEKGI